MLKIANTLLMTIFAVGLVICGATARAEDSDVDLLLVLAADVSRSVDDDEFRLQREGYAAAVADPRVVHAMTAGPNRRVAVAFVEWSSEWEQNIVVDWTIIAGEPDARAVATRILAAERGYRGRTSISGAIDFSLKVLARSPFQSTRRVIDVSGDGTNNGGRDIAAARNEAIAQGVTINGLVILSDTPLTSNPAHTHPAGGLRAYYEEQVIGGPGAFVIEVDGFGAFRQSLISKLMREVSELALRQTSQSAHSRGHGGELCVPSQGSVPRLRIFPRSYGNQP